jgi:hypothetical protein
MTDTNNTFNVADLTKTWFNAEWQLNFPGCTGVVPSPYRLADLLHAADLVARGECLATARDFPSGNTGSIAGVFDCYKSGPAFLEELCSITEHPQWEPRDEDFV